MSDTKSVGVFGSDLALGTEMLITDLKSLFLDRQPLPNLGWRVYLFSHQFYILEAFCVHNNFMSQPTIIYTFNLAIIEPTTVFCKYVVQTTRNVNSAQDKALLKTKI